MKKNNNISTCLWFDSQAEEAAQFYTSVFDNAEITATTHYTEESSGPSGKPAGSVLTVGFEIENFPFMALNGGPHFKINPSISFFLNFDPSKDENAAENLEKLWDKLSEGGYALMPLDQYPFSEKYGWIQDKFGVSWQLILSDPKGDDRPFIVPSLMFSADNTNKAEEAMQFYTDVFSDSKIGQLARYPEKTGPAEEGSIMFGDFTIQNTWIAAMDSGVEHDFNFNEGVSLVVHCKNQDEIDYHWNKLSAVPESEACGWLKDKYGVSWQIV
ncbi:MAG TPA: VOC family protein, partial [Balneolaceae bacterium]|nr:VOC family protein [Balneolaceae bacterium]